MAVIPVYEARVGLDTDTKGMPKPNLSNAEAAAAYSQGQALQGLGGALGRAANTAFEIEEHNRRRAEQDENTKAAFGYDIANRQQQADMLAAKEKIAADGAGFQKQRLEAFDKAASAFIGTLPERLKPEYEQRIKAQRISFQSQTGQIETAQSQNYTRSAVQTMAQGAETDIRNDPAATDPAIQRLTEVIQNSRLLPIEKMERIAALRHQLLAASAAKRYENDPAGMAIAMGRGAARDPVATDIPNVGRALLNAIAGGESAGKYDIRYTPKGGATFDLSTGQHPRIREAGPEGPSDAAGRYQFLSSTWDGLGGGAFTPENQDRRAWQLAQRDYKSRTGRELQADLENGGLTRSILQTLAPTWTALRSGAEGKIASYNDSLSRFGGKGPGDPRYAELPAATKDRLVNGAQYGQKREQGGFKIALGDDLASIERTGVPLSNPSLTPENVSRVMGPEVAADWQAERSRRLNLFNAMSGVDGLSEAEINARVERLRPQPGVDGFGRDDEVYNQARKRADKIIEQRNSDPAAAVDSLPEVRAVRSQGVQHTPNGDVPGVTWQSLIRARLEAQGNLGIPEPMALTKPEALRIGKQLRAIGEDDPDKMLAAIQQLHGVYGDYTDEAIASVLQHDRVSRDLAAMTSQIVTKVMRGELPKPSEARRLDNATDAAKLGDAMKGVPPQVQEMAGSIAGQQLAILDSRRNDPNAIAYFDSLFGAGAAKRALAEIDRRRPPGGRP